MKVIINNSEYELELMASDLADIEEDYDKSFSELLDKSRAERIGTVQLFFTYALKPRIDKDAAKQLFNMFVKENGLIEAGKMIHKLVDFLMAEQNNKQGSTPHNKKKYSQ